jgi:hypothetical protein
MADALWVMQSDVEIGLPGKMEVIMYAHMTPLQKELNEKLLDKSLIVRRPNIPLQNPYRI